MQDKFEDLRTYVAVVQCRGFAAAARRLGVVKSAVSRRIQELERRLGVQLLNRSTRTISLTDAGRDFFARAESLLAGLEEAEELARDGAVEAAGMLRVLGPASFGRLHLTRIVCAFLDRHPRVSVDLSLSDNRVDLLGSGFDLAVRIGDLPDSTLSARRIGPIRRIACASPAYIRRFGAPRVPEDLVRHHGAVYSNLEDREYWHFVNRQSGETKSVKVSSRLRVNDGDALVKAALAGAGIVVLPTFIVHEAVVSGRLVPVLLPFEQPATALHAVYPSRRLIPGKVRKFVDHLAASVSPEPYWDLDIFGRA